MRQYFSLMDYRWQLILAFGAGILLQLLLFTNFRPRLDKLGMSMVAGLAVFAFSVFPLSVTFFLYYLALAIFFSLFYFKAIVPMINEYVLLCLTIVFWYVYMVYYRLTPVNNILLFIVFLFGTMVTLVVTFSHATLSYFWKIVMFVWYFILVVMLMVYVFGSQVTSSIFGLTYYFGGLIPAFFHTVALETIHWSTALFTAMGFFCLLANVIYVIGLSPLATLMARKNKKLQARLQQWREEGIQLFTARFTDSQIPVKLSLAILLVLPGVFAANHFLRVVDVNMLIIFFIISPAFITTYEAYRRKKLKQQELELR